MTDLSGTITDASGTAISSATVFAIGMIDFELHAWTTTDANGEYSFTGLPDFQEYHVGSHWQSGGEPYNGESKPFTPGEYPDYLAITASYDPIEIRDVSDWSLMDSFNPSGDKAGVLDISPDNSFLAYGTDVYDTGTPALYVHNVGSWSVETTFSVSDEPDSVDFSHDSNLLTFGQTSAPLEIYDTADWSVAQTLPQPGYQTGAVAFDPSGGRFGYHSDNYHIYDTADWSKITTLDTVPPRAAGFSPGGGYLAINDDGGSRITVYDTADWSTANQMTISEDVWDIAWSPQGAYLALGSYGEVTTVYDTADWSVVHSTSNAGASVSFSPDGSHLARGNASGDVKIDNTSDWSLADSFTMANGGVAYLEYSP